MQHSSTVLPTSGDSVIIPGFRTPSGGLFDLQTWLCNKTNLLSLMDFKNWLHLIDISYLII